MVNLALEGDNPLSCFAQFCYKPFIICTLLASHLQSPHFAKDVVKTVMVLTGLKELLCKTPSVTPTWQKYQLIRFPYILYLLIQQHTTDMLCLQPLP